MSKLQKMLLVQCEHGARAVCGTSPALMSRNSLNTTVLNTDADSADPVSTRAAAVTGNYANDNEMAGSDSF